MALGVEHRSLLLGDKPHAVGLLGWPLVPALIGVGAVLMVVKRGVRGLVDKNLPVLY